MHVNIACYLFLDAWEMRARNSQQASAAANSENTFMMGRKNRAVQGYAIHKNVNHGKTVDASLSIICTLSMDSWATFTSRLRTSEWSNGANAAEINGNPRIFFKMSETVMNLGLE